MKKAFVIFGIFAALLALFAISCSAAVLRDTQYPAIRVPAESNFAQPRYGRSDAPADSGIILWNSAFVPSTAARSAFNAVSSYYTPDNNQYASGATVSSWNGASDERMYFLFRYTAEMLGNANVPAVGAYLHIIFDFGGSSGTYSTASAVLENLFVRVGLSDDAYDVPVSIMTTKNVGFVDIPVLTGTVLPNLALYYRRPSSVSNTTVSGYYLCINNIWAFNDNHETYTIENWIVDNPCGYTTCYMQYNDYLERLDFDDVNTQYYYDLGYANAESNAYTAGYNAGYGDAIDSVVDQNGDPVSIRTLILAVPDAMVGLLRSLFNWEFAGFNLYFAFKFLLALLAVCFVVRLVMRSLL